MKRLGNSYIQSVISKNLSKEYKIEIFDTSYNSLQLLFLNEVICEGKIDLYEMKTFLELEKQLLEFDGKTKSINNEHSFLSTLLAIMALVVGLKMDESNMESLKIFVVILLIGFFGIYEIKNKEIEKHQENLIYNSFKLTCINEFEESQGKLLDS